MTRNHRLAVSAAALVCIPAVTFAQTELQTLFGDLRPGGYMGNDSTPLGDINGDGFDDYAIAAYFEGPAGNGAGRVRIYSGVDGDVLRTLQGDDAGDFLGWSIASIGDLDGDGVRDLVAGVPGDDNGAMTTGSINVFSAATGSMLYRIDGEGPGAGIGTSVVALDDLDGDGFEDFAFNVRRPSNGPQRGAIRAVSGATGAEIYTFLGLQAADDLGAYSMERVPDVDGDGIDDIAAGAPLATRGADVAIGSAVLISGATGGLLWEAVGSAAGDELGWAVASAADIDGDGIADVAIGAPRDDVGGENRGSVRFVSGATGLALYTLRGETAEQAFGKSLGMVGDIDADGDVELAIGTSAVWYSMAVLSTVYIVNPVTGLTEFELQGDTVGDAFGYSIGTAGDVDGDGYPDMIVGAVLDDRNGINSGSARIVGREFVLGTPLCIGAPNSTGTRATLVPSSLSGFDASQNDLVLDVGGLPSSTVGYFLVADDRAIVPNAGGSEGTLCIATPSIGRYSAFPLQSGLTGAVSFQPDLVFIPTSTGFMSATAGDVLNFQFWYRDALQGTATSNFSDAASVQLL